MVNHTMAKRQPKIEMDTARAGVFDLHHACIILPQWIAPNLMLKAGLDWLTIGQADLAQSLLECLEVFGQLDCDDSHVHFHTRYRAPG